MKPCKICGNEPMIHHHQMCPHAASDCSHGCEHSDVEATAGNPSRSHENVVNLILVCLVILEVLLPITFAICAVMISLKIYNS